MNNLKIWDSLATPPQTALKAIGGGRLKGKTDINPQWRMRAITEQFGPVGFGWNYTIERLWTEPGTGGEICAFALVGVKVKVAGEWSEYVPGIGGNLLIEQEKNGQHTNDEAYKMAVTDGLSVAFKAFGVAAEVYLGNFDGSKYTGRPNAPAQSAAQPPARTGKNFDLEKVLAQLKKADSVEALDGVIANWKSTIDGWGDTDKQAARATYASVKALVLDPHRNEPPL